jgi:hypothetical protein
LSKAEKEQQRSWNWVVIGQRICRKKMMVKYKLKVRGYRFYFFFALPLNEPLFKIDSLDTIEFDKGCNLV